MALAAFFATAAQAQTVVTLVSNTGKQNHANHGRMEPLAQRFDTGAAPLGYLLESVVVQYINSETGSVSAKVCTVTGSDQPTSTCTDFTAPSVPQGGNRTFTAPGDGMVLAPNTKYTVVLTPDETNTDIYYRATKDNGEDFGGLPGWNIAGEYRLYNGTSWVSDDDSHALKIRLRGSIRMISVGPNANATGAPAITGPAQVGRTLMAGKGTIADPDGLTATFPGGYFFQWIRVDSSNNETDIAGATSDTYTPVTTDLGRRLKVKVLFFDDGDEGEARTSAATSPVVPGAAPCPAGSVWCTVLTSGGNPPGFSAGRGTIGAIGSLDDETFTFDGAGYTVTDILSGGTHSIYLATEPDLPADGGGLTLHVQRLNGTLDLALADGSLIHQDGVGGNAWEFFFVTETGPGNPSLLRLSTRINEAYTDATDPGTRVTVWLSPPPGVSFESPHYSAYEAGEGAPVTVTLTPAPSTSVTIPISATGQDGATSADWRGIPSSLTFAAGERSKTFTVTAVEDVAADEGESVLLEFGTLPSGTPAGYRTTTVVHFFDKANPGDARLVGGNGLPTDGDSGRLQVFYRMQGGTPEQRNGQWGTVCDDRIDRSFTDYDSVPPKTVDNHALTVLCKQIDPDYNKGELIDNTQYRLADDDQAPIWLDDLRCKEGAKTLDDCYHAGIGRSNCTHREDVVLQCTGMLDMQVAAEPLRVAFVDVPKTGHDGETAFTFKLDFSEAVAITAEDMRDHALDVTGATVTSAALADGRDELWEFTLEPSGTDFVSITVSGKDSCSDIGALCTALGAGLENRLSTVIPYVPAPAEAGLTAEFVDVPEEHSGDSYATYTVKLLFNEEVKVANKRMRKRILKLQNAVLEEARRIDRRKDYWEFRVRPSSHRAITLSLASAEECGARDVICTFDGRPLSEPATATIIGPPGMSVADAEVEEGPDAVLEFAVTLDRAPRREVTVNYETEDGTAVAGEDYVRTNGMLVFAAGETEKTVSVEVLDDAHNEGSETLTLRLGGPVGAWLADGEAVGTIRNTDHMPQAWLARFGRTVADQVIEAVEGRMTASRSPGTEVTVAGQRIGAGAVTEADREEQDLSALTDWLRGREDERPDEARALPGGALLAGTSFALTEGSRESGLGSVWGRAAHSRFDGREGALTLDGEVESALLGADLARGRGTAGLVLSRSRGEGGYRSPQGSGEVEATLMGLYPWGSYAASERLVLWGVLGHGEGTLTLRPAGLGAIETDMDLSMAAAGLRGLLAAAPAEGGLELSTVSDMLLVRTTSEEIRENEQSLASTDAEVTRVRVGLEGAWRGLGSLEPSFGIGMRHDGGDAETGLGADIGAGLAWTDPGLGLEAEFRARGLLTHEASGFRERGFAGSLAWDPEPSSDRGPRLTLSQTVGGPAAGGVEALLRPETARVLEAANDPGSGSGAGNSGQSRLEARFGYGWSSFGGRYVTVPEVGLGVSETAREYIHGWRLVEAKRAGLAFRLDVEAARREPMTGNAAPEHRLGFGLGWRREDATFEFRLEGSRLQPVSGNRAPEHRIGLTLTARW